MNLRYLNKNCPVCGGYVVLLDSGSEMCEKCHYILPGSTQTPEFIHEDWYETRQIEYLLALDEEENKEMNYFQSTDFNAGMLYSVVEKEAVKMLKDKGVLSYSSNYSIPNIQLIPKDCETFNEGDIIDATIRAATEHFEAVYGKNFKLDIYGWQRVKQYCLFFYRISRKEQPKEMTITEIEEALGYKVKVIGGK